MTLRELDRILPSKLIDETKTTTRNNPPSCIIDKIRYYDYTVERAEATLSHGGLEVKLEMWIVVGTDALVVTAPKEWVDLRTPVFCRDAQDLCDFFVDRMYDMWGQLHCDKGDVGESLGNMGASITRTPDPKPLVKPESPSELDTSKLELQ